MLIQSTPKSSSNKIAIEHPSSGNLQIKQSHSHLCSRASDSSLSVTHKPTCRWIGIEQWIELAQNLAKEPVKLPNVPRMIINKLQKAITLCCQYLALFKPVKTDSTQFDESIKHEKLQHGFVLQWNSTSTPTHHSS
ncbi:hypothetical protein CROQUDRAFT_97437 [Cronartium quercuum f. sp. fusiforme G11]|uniref:Uncharacterized protein n=1 Tax=Cronartium quercuum f. sp. fusiforme G11 TaxID=708437 RepID=A0A9P6T802_9BASI|nr:hypothetical protein CROQUDRAFT_97437 [Cronartium quercuum f. sp. fusiforme G11]